VPLKPKYANRDHNVAVNFKDEHEAGSYGFKSTDPIASYALSVSTIKSILLMLYREIITFSSKVHKNKEVYHFEKT
jgi:hypothetical protein